MGIVYAQARTTRLYTGIPDAAACGAADDEHRVIVERIKARDALGAAQAMSSHIEQAWSRRRTPAPGRDVAVT
ncbi:FCD domain-containing protein [Micromonospora sp. CPCC 206061]|uniref:FCD domain-containing protein n=1 Tax=Micromonospora sp. CPCC 206061 TaxID=3122410 RepID=UPI002FF0FD20